MPVITRTAWTDDDGTGTTGTVINNAAKTELYNQIDALIAATIATVAVLGAVNAFSADQYLAATKKLFFDGGGNTYIYEVGADDLRIMVGGFNKVKADSTGVTLFGATTLDSVGAFAASDKYLVVDANGVIHKSALGPAS